MNLMPMGDYYLWNCGWCDSANKTIWTRLETNNIHCSVCQRRVSLTDSIPLQSRSQEPRHRYFLHKNYI